MDFALMQRVLPFFIDAALITILISLCAMVLGLSLGAVLCLLRLSPNFLLRWPAATYISLFRGTPSLVQMFLLYFGGPQIGIDLSPFAAGSIALGLNIAAYMAETMRGAIQSVDKGQIEASRTLGFSKTATLVYVTLPQAARLMISPLGVNVIWLVKSTALVSAISVVELAYTAQRYISSTYKPFEIFSIAAVLYIVIVFALTQVTRWLDRRFALK